MLHKLANNSLHLIWYQTTNLRLVGRMLYSIHCADSGAIAPIGGNMKNLNSVIGLLFVALLMCCASADVMHLDNITRSPKDPSKVQILLDEPKQSYIAIAIVEASDEGWGLSLDEIKNKLIKEAANLGGDAVIIGRESKDAGTVFMPAGKTFFAAPIEKKKLVGKVIVFK